MKKKSPVYAALDLHSRHSVLGSMDHGGKTGAWMRFATEAETLLAQVARLRQARRPLFSTIKAGYRQWGVLKLHGLKVFSKTWRQQYLPQLPGEEERRMILRLYAQHDHAVAQWKETLKEVERVGKAFWEVGEFERIPGVGPIAAHVFSAIIEEPGRFKTKHQLWKYSGLGSTDTTSDNKPVG